jgi:hypothetical protein
MKLQYCTYENETVPFPKTVAGDNANEATGVAIRIKQTTNLNKKIIISATTIAQLLFNSGSSKYLHSNTSLTKSGSILVQSGNWEFFRKLS